VTVRADDLALGDLCHNAIPTSVPHHLTHGIFLVSQMVELKHHDIIFTTVNAWMVIQVFTNAFAILSFNALIASPHQRFSLIFGPCVTKTTFPASACATTVL
jgi:hypothetical protein